MEFKIESGIPFASPNRGGRGRKPTVFPFENMEVGDSFLIECDSASKKVVDSWRRKLLVAKKRFNEAYNDDAWEFRTATQPNGIRVWRVQPTPAAT